MGKLTGLAVTASGAVAGGLVGSEFSEEIAEVLTGQPLEEARDVLSAGFDTSGIEAWTITIETASPAVGAIVGGAVCAWAVVKTGMSQ